MKIGTKSVLFGVHCFLWHWITVAIAWKFYHHRWPRGAAEWLAIFCHDLGYWGCRNIDGDEGQTHPMRSARMVEKLFFVPVNVRADAIILILGHSSHFARRWGIPLSGLYAPDKIGVLFDPVWFSLLRGVLSGEVEEFMDNSPMKHYAWRRRAVWLAWYRQKVIRDFNL